MVSRAGACSSDRLARAQNAGDDDGLGSGEGLAVGVGLGGAVGDGVALGVSVGVGDGEGVALGDPPPLSPATSGDGVESGSPRTNRTQRPPRSPPESQQRSHRRARPASTPLQLDRAAPRPGRDLRNDPHRHRLLAGRVMLRHGGVLDGVQAAGASRDNCGTDRHDGGLRGHGRGDLGHDAGDDAAAEPIDGPATESSVEASRPAGRGMLFRNRAGRPTTMATLPTHVVLARAWRLSRLPLGTQRTPGSAIAVKWRRKLLRARTSVTSADSGFTPSAYATSLTCRPWISRRSRAARCAGGTRRNASSTWRRNSSCSPPSILEGRANSCLGSHATAGLRLPALRWS